MRQFTVIALLLVLSACGFQLRSQAQLPPRFAPLAVEGVSADHPFYRIAAQRLAAQTEWQAQRAGAAAVVVIESEQWQTRVLSLAGGGVTQQQELRLLLVYRVETADGAVLLGRDELDLTRDYAYDAAQVLSKAAEQGTLRGDIYQQAFDFILTRLRTAG